MFQTTGFKYEDCNDVNIFLDSKEFVHGGISSAYNKRHIE